MQSPDVGGGCGGDRKKRPMKSEPFPIGLDRQRWLHFSDSSLIRLREVAGFEIDNMLRQKLTLTNLQTLIFFGLALGDQLPMDTIKQLVTPKRAPDLWLEVAKALCTGTGVPYVDPDYPVKEDSHG